MTLRDGRKGNVVVVAPRKNPKGAVLVMPKGAGEVLAVPISEALALLKPSTVVDVLCLQERAFGASGLTPPQPGS